MAGAAAAGRLSERAPVGSPAGDLVLRLAQRADEPELRRLLRESPVEGEIRLALEREPDFFLAAGAGGAEHHTVVAQDASEGRLVGMGTRTVMEVFVNGEPLRLGYLSQLRLEPACRGRRRLLAGAYAVLRDLRAPGEALFDLTTIVSDNQPARRLLLSGIPGLPTYRPLEPFITLFLPTRRSRPVRPPRGLRIERGVPGRMAEIVTCLDRNRRRFQFAARFSAADLLSPGHCPGLLPEDFLLAVGRDGLLGCVALWDQQDFKQIVVRGYGPRLARLRPWLNRAAPLFGAPRLPEPGERLSHAFLSHLAVQDDSPEIFESLLAAAALEARRRNVGGLVLGLAARSPFLRVMRRRFRARRYESLLCAVHGEDGRRAVEALDERLPHPEVALL